MSRRVFRRGLLLLVWLVCPLVAVGQVEPPRILTLQEVLDTTDEQEMRWPLALAVEDDLLGVADAFRARLLIFERIGVSWSLRGQVELRAAPVGVARSNGRWVLSLRGASELQTIDDNGIVGAIPLPSGFVPGALAATRAGELLVYDTARSSLARLAKDGALETVVDVDGYVTGLAGDGQGGILAAIGDRGRIERFDADGAVDTAWDLPGVEPVPCWPSGLAVDSGGRVFVADRHGGRILVLDSLGRWIGLGSRRGWDQGLVLRPAGVASGSGGELFVADFGNGRVQVFRTSSSGGGS